MELTLYQTSSLNKTLIHDEKTPRKIKRISCLKGEEISYQIVTRLGYNRDYKAVAKVSVTSPLSDYITIREVGNVPSELPAFTSREEGGYDDDYISIKPGLYPDPLYEIKDGNVEVIPNFFRSFWVSVKTNEDIDAGFYPIEVRFYNEEKEIDSKTVMEIEVIDEILPKQELIVTQWFHADCLSGYYRVESLSEKHWEIIDKFIKTASDNGINMMLTPVFTPPLDTEIGKERPTIQLVDIKYSDGKYEFDFKNLKKWVDICKKNDIKYLEISHLFTQWGAKFTPKIIVSENGEKIKKFGWHVAADSDEYVLFLNQFLPALTEFLKSENMAENTYFHISDEPHEPDKEAYKKARNIVKPLLKEFKVIDAFSDFELYKEGLVDTPVVGLYKIKPYLEAKVPKLWAYYCCTHCKDVSNRFFAQPSARNRIIALQLYKYNIEGFLQWGYNFYYSQLSRGLINPFLVTDARNAFPSGDPFSVYPGEEGVIESLRLKVFKEALQDLSALKCLEKYMSKDEIIKMIEEKAGFEIEFNRYPKGEEFIIELREEINSIIKTSVNKKKEKN